MNKTEKVILVKLTFWWGIQTISKELNMMKGGGNTRRHTRTKVFTVVTVIKAPFPR